jgi:hypothetical protein
VKHGKCKLCQLDKPLCESHLIPRAFYKRLRGTGTGNTDPYMVTSKGARSTSAQYQDHLLCLECETRFKDGGEDYVLGISATQTGFHIFDILQATTASFSRPDCNLYTAAETPTIDREKIAYFALSIFWRASIKTWKLRQGKHVRIELGKKYNEELRKYLVGETRPPNSAAMSVAVTTDLKHRKVVFPPTGSVRGQSPGFSFLVCGIHFELAMGGTIPAYLKHLSILKGPEQYIVAYDFTEHPAFQLARN